MLPAGDGRPHHDADDRGGLDGGGGVGVTVAVGVALVTVVVVATAPVEAGL